MAFDIRPGFQRTLSVSFTKADGTPGTVEGVPVWAVSEELLANLIPELDGLSCVMQHNGSVGQTNVSCTADGDLGAGVFPIIVSDTATMLAPLGAVIGSMSVGEEVPIP